MKYIWAECTTKKAKYSADKLYKLGFYWALKWCLVSRLASFKPDMGAREWMLSCSKWAERFIGDQHLMPRLFDIKHQTLIFFKSFLLLHSEITNENGEGRSLIKCSSIISMRLWQTWQKSQRQEWLYQRHRKRFLKKLMDNMKLWISYCSFQ